MTKLPPFLPGSAGSQTIWMWQGGKFERLVDFLWSPTPYSLQRSFTEGTTSLAGLLGPFLLAGMLGFLAWRSSGFRNVRWTAHDEAHDRARIFVLIWFVVMLAGTSALPNINPFFQIRYAILTMIPASLLLAWIFSLFEESRGQIPSWAALLCVVLLIVQSGINLSRSIAHRRALGQVMVAVDDAYRYINETFPNDRLALMPGFLSYDYWPDSARSIKKREVLARNEDLAFTHPSGTTLALSWGRPISPQLQPVKEFSGCGDRVLFDILVPCMPERTIFLTRYIANPKSQPADRVTAARTLLALSFQNCREGRNEECIEAARKALELKPDYAEAFNNIAAAYENMGKWDEAVQAAQQALRLKPDFQLARNNLDWSLSQRKRQIERSKP